MNKIIVFGGNHHNTLGVIRSIGEKGLTVIVILQKCSLYDCCLRFSKYISHLHYIEDDNDAITILKEHYWNEAEKPIILCSSDSAICLLDSHFEELKSHFIFFNINSQQGAINYYVNKIHTFPYAEQSGINIIRTWHISSQNEIPDDIVFPCLTKPNSSLGGSKSDMVICYNKEELRNNLKDGIDYLVQEYIEKDFELNIIGASMHHGDKVVLPAVIRKIRDQIHYQSMYMRLDDFDEYPFLNRGLIESFIKKLGYEGLFSVELLCKDSKCYFLEVNLRTDGCGYIYTAAGVNLPYIWIKHMLPGNSNLPPEELVCKTPFYLMNDYDIKNIKKREVSAFRWLHQMLHADAFFIFQIKDIKPFIYWIFHPLLRFMDSLISTK